VSDPVRTLAGFHIVGLRDRRLALTADPSRVRVSIDQIFLPASTGDAAARLDQAKKLRETVKGCADMAAAAKEVRSTRPAHLGTFQLKDLSAEMRQTVLALKVGELSEPVRLPDGLMLLMVCERDDPAPALPSREQVENGLLVQRLNMLSRRHLRDLRLASIVDVRV
jgi:peptidyl-prolyl cis-trans isomerase SurA